jgi:hypothetical protein
VAPLRPSGVPVLHVFSGAIKGWQIVKLLCAV